MAKCFVLISFIAILFQSCFVVGIGNSPFWNNTKEVGYSIPVEGTTQVKVSLDRNTFTIPIPFFILYIEKNKFHVSFKFETTNHKYQKIDSAKFTLCKLDGSIFYEGLCYNTSKCFEKLHQFEERYYYEAWAESDYNIIISKSERKEDILVHSKFFIQTFGDGQIIEKFANKLIIRNPPFIWVESFF